MDYVYYSQDSNNLQKCKNEPYLCFLMEVREPFKVIHVKDRNSGMRWRNILITEKLCIVVLQSQT